MAASLAPYQILSELAQRSLANAAGLPEQDEAIELWSGIGFKFGDTHYLAQMGKVSEILHLPKYTAVPGVKAWVRGVANVRGRLLPIMDLSRFFQLPASHTKARDKRVLVIEQGDSLSGVIVEGILGMQYFSADALQTEVGAEVPEGMRRFVLGSFLKSDITWHVFDTAALTADEDFMDAALR